jgi:hypothetical protein
MAVAVHESFQEVYKRLDKEAQVDSAELIVISLDSLLDVSRGDATAATNKSAKTFKWYAQT